jgi:hypothetical protein
MQKNNIKKHKIALENEKHKIALKTHSVQFKVQSTGNSK